MILFHKNCLDGLCAAVVTAAALNVPFEDCYAVQYGEPFPTPESKHIYIVDFSYPAPVLQQVLDDYPSLEITIIDHHKTCPHDFEHPRLTMIFDLEESGASLAFKHFLPDLEPPQTVRIVKDRDLWQHKLPETRATTTAMYMTLQNPILTQLQDMADWLVNGPPLTEGEAMVRFLDSQIQVAMRNQHSIKVQDLTIPAVNAPPFMASDMGNIIAREHPAAAIYFRTPKKWIISLRSSAENPDHVDVAELAQSMGGGGHKHAAGFTIANIEELLCA